MKQHITIKQLNELSEKGKEKLRGWWLPEHGDFTNYVDTHGLMMVGESYYDNPFDPKFIEKTEGVIILPLLSIGQMIEFLQKTQKVFHIYQKIEGDFVYLVGFSNNGTGGKYQSKELCDALWEAIKNILEEK